MKIFYGIGLFAMIFNAASAAIEGNISAMAGWAVATIYYAIYLYQNKLFEE